MTGFVLLTAAFLLTGCMGQNLSVDRGQAGLFYSDLRQIYNVNARVVNQWCASPMASPSECREAADGSEKLVELDARARQIIATPGKEVDWAKLLDLSAWIVKVLTKVVVGVVPPTVGPTLPGVVPPGPRPTLRLLP